MADVELVIKISEEIYESRYGSECDEKDCLIIDAFRSAIINGIPLPKGHGRIVDIGLYEGKVIASRKYCGVNRLVEVAELDTLIEADKEQIDENDKRKS